MANKKLNQLVTKPSIGTGDLFPLADATTGQLYKTTISALGTAIGSGVSSVNTLVGAVVLDTDDIQELASPVNKWYTDLRARAALSAGTGISYNSGTGVITNTITQYTDALARNAVSLTTTGSNGSATYNSSTGVLNVPAYTLSGLGGQPLAGNLTALAGLSYSSLGFIKMTGVGTLALDTNIYALDSAVVKLTGNQTIAGTKTFSEGIISTALDNNYFLRTEDIDFINQAVGNSIRLHGRTNTNIAYLYFGSNAGSNIFGFNGTKFTLDGALDISGILNASSFIKIGGTSAQFLKADGSVDASTYLTTATASSTYLALSGGTLTGPLNGTSLLMTGNIQLGTTANTTTNKQFISSNYSTTNSYPSLLFQTPSGGSFSGIGIDTSNNFVIGRSSSINGNFTFQDFNISNSNGNVSIGINTAIQALDVYRATSVSSYVVARNGSGVQTAIGVAGDNGSLLGTLSNHNLRIVTNGSVIATFTTASDFFINSTSNTLGGKLATTLNDNGFAFSALKQGTFGAGILVRVDNTNSDYLRFYYSSSNTQTGSINTNGTTTAYNVTSDYRLKQDLKPIKGLELVNKIKVYDYEWKTDKSRMDGVLAHELAEVLPYAVTGEKDGERMQGVDYSKIVPVMVQAIQETDSKVVQLEKKIVILEAEIQTLKNK